MKTLLIGLVLGVALFVMPVATQAAGLVPCGGPTEKPCQSCDVVTLEQNVIGWIVLMLGIVASLICVYAGVKLVTAGGNRHAAEEAKSMMTNMVIGYLIVLAGWLLIDYGMKALLNVGEFGTWNVVQCVDQPQPDDYVAWQDQSQGLSNGGFSQNTCDAGPAGNTICTNQITACTAQGGTPTTVTADPNNYTVQCTFAGSAGVKCDIGPSGTYTLCTSQTKACTDKGGTPTTDTSNPAGYVVNCQMPTGGGGGTCSVVTDPSNACYPSKLTCFGDPEDASQICNLESQGGRTDVMSGSDICKDRKSFSGGLWQINLLANYSMVPGCNGSFFTKTGSWKGSDTQGGCLDPQSNRYGVEYCAMWDCEITNQPVYDQCVAQIKNPPTNTAIACDLYAAARGWGPWQTSAKSCGLW